jgi:hypothetical protein
MRLIAATAFAGLTYAAPIYAQAIDIVGTYRLISEERIILATGEVIPTRGVTGYITYTREGRMVALIVRDGWGILDDLQGRRIRDYTHQAGSLEMAISGRRRDQDRKYKS